MLQNLKQAVLAKDYTSQKVLLKPMVAGFGLKIITMMTKEDVLFYLRYQLRNNQGRNK